MTIPGKVRTYFITICTDNYNNYFGSINKINQLSNLLQLTKGGKHTE
jgi:hypothetical protein